MRRAEFALGHGAVAALGSRYHEHLLQDTHCRAVPPCCTPKSTQISPKCQTPAAGGGSSPIPPPCLRDVVQHQQTLPWGISLRAGNRALEQLIASKESSNTARISPRGTRAAVGALLKSDGAPAPPPASGTLPCPPASRGETRAQLLSRSSEPHPQRLPGWRVQWDNDGAAAHSSGSASALSNGNPSNGWGVPGVRDPIWSWAQRSPFLPAISSSQLGFGLLPSLVAGKNPLEDHLEP